MFFICWYHIKPVNAINAVSPSKRQLKLFSNKPFNNYYYT